MQDRLGIDKDDGEHETYGDDYETTAAEDDGGVEADSGDDDDDTDKRSFNNKRSRRSICNKGELPQ